MLPAISGRATHLRTLTPSLPYATSHLTVDINGSSLAGIRDEVENRGRYG
jgi:hypothetical protein